MNGDQGAAPIIPADLIAAAEADQAQPMAPPGAPDAPAVPPADPAKEAAELIQFARSMLLPLYPRLEAVYTPDVCGRLGAAAAPLLAKYGLTLGGLFERWAPEIGFAIVALPLVRPTIEALRADKPAAPPAADLSAAAADPAPPAPDKALVDRFPGLNGG